jgi:hypothetical protein
VNARLLFARRLAFGLLIQAISTILVDRLCAGVA